jgi:hypothetical protein
LKVEKPLRTVSHWPDRHLLVVWMLIVPAAMPLFQPTITKSADGLLHLYRVVALQHVLTQGQIAFPRWLPDLAYGYGFPLFVFYAPLSYYVTLGLSLPGLSTIAAFNTSFVLAFFLAGTGAYLFTTDIFGPRAAVLAAVAYVYAPFQLINTLLRGSLPAAWAMALFPFVFWIFGRLIRHSLIDRRFLTPLLPSSALILGAALLTHNTLSLLFVPLLGLYAGLLLLAAYFRNRTANATSSGWAGFQVGLAFLGGFGVATFFLVPAIVEQEFAQVQRVITSPDFDFRFNFVTLDRLLAVPEPANTGLLNPEFPSTLGVVQAGLAVLGLIGLVVVGFLSRRQSPNHSAAVTHLPEFGFALIALAVAILMMLPVSEGIWELLPLLAFVQFPHRFLGPAALVLAMLAGAVTVLVPGRLQFGLILGAILLIVVASMPLLYPHYYRQPPSEPGLLDMMDYEHASGAIGTTSFGEYLPIWVEQVPAESPLESMYRSGTTIERLDQAYLPPAAEVESAVYGPNQSELIFNSSQAFQAVFHTFYFPGWEARIDGRSALVTPVTERGLISVTIPAGRHRLELYFGETGLRRVANVVTAVVVALLVAWLVAGYVYRGRHSPGIAATNKSGTIIQHSPQPGFKPWQLLVLMGLALALMAVKAFYLDRFDSPLKQTFDGTAFTMANVRNRVNFGDQVDLLGYDLEQAAVRPGEELTLTAYWQARQPLPRSLSALAQLVDAEGHLYAAQDNLHPGSLKSTLWQPWGFVRDPHVVPIPPGTPPGDYFRLQVKSDKELAWTDVLAIPISVTKTPRPPTVASLGISRPVSADVTSELRLLGASPERDIVPRNALLRTTIFWEALQDPDLDYQVTLRLVAPDGSSVLQETTRPAHDRYPTTRWSTGERIRDNHVQWIPANLPVGQYQLQLQIVDGTGQPASDWIELGPIKIVE